MQYTPPQQACTRGSRCATLALIYCGEFHLYFNEPANGPVPLRAALVGGLHDTHKQRARALALRVRLCGRRSFSAYKLLSVYFPEKYTLHLAPQHKKGCCWVPLHVPDTLGKLPPCPPLADENCAANCARLRQNHMPAYLSMASGYMVQVVKFQVCLPGVCFSKAPSQVSTHSHPAGPWPDTH